MAASTRNLRSVGTGRHSIVFPGRVTGLRTGFYGGRPCDMIVTFGGLRIGYAAASRKYIGSVTMDPVMQVSNPPSQREAASAAEQGARRVPELHDPHLFLNRE